MRTPLLKGGVVVNIIFAEAGYVSPDPLIAVGPPSDTARIGDKFDGSTYVSPPSVFDKPGLLKYAEFRSEKADNVGIAVVISSGDALVDTSAAGRADINGLLALVSLGQPLPKWHQSNGDLTVTADDLKAIGLAVAAHRTAVVAALTAAQAGIAGGVITTPAQIEALAWPGA